MDLREAVAAGSFYPGKKAELERQLRALFSKAPESEKSNCVVAPHAGYEYSGRVSACSFKALEKNPTFILLGPNHTGLGEGISVSGSDYWETPLGKLAVDKALRESLLASLGIEADDVAHYQEHSLEVELPFIQALFGKPKILPITIMQHDFSGLERLGNAIASLKGKFSVVASGDFTHHEPLESARKKDMQAIEAIKGLDAKGFHSMVLSRRLSICGLSPVTAAMCCCRALGKKAGKLLLYDTSAASTGDSSSVVGYASIAFY